MFRRSFQTGKFCCNPPALILDRILPTSPQPQACLQLFERSSDIFFLIRLKTFLNVYPLPTSLTARGVRQRRPSSHRSLSFLRRRPQNCQLTGPHFLLLTSLLRSKYTFARFASLSHNASSGSKERKDEGVVGKAKENAGSEESQHNVIMKQKSKVEARNLVLFRGDENPVHLHEEPMLSP
jgi:hypothetical protein